MQELCKLLFELSNEDRLTMLIELKKTPMKLSRISDKFTFTVPETARNVSRLSAANLIIKDVEGAYHLTPFGEEALRLLPGLQFLSKNKKYFISHTLTELPQEFATSLGALKDCRAVNELTEMLYIIENLIREAQQYVWFMSDQLLASGLPLAVEAVKRGVEFKKLMPKNANIPENILKIANDPIFEQASSSKRFESRYLERVDIAIFISEKEVGAICFPDLEGRFDYSGFTSKSELTHSWSKSLYSYYWNISKR
jgi:predicted transcriptional regulator